MLSNFSEFIKSNYYSVDLGLHFPLANMQLFDLVSFSKVVDIFLDKKQQQQQN